MSNGTGQHPNAPLTPEGRRRMVACVLDRCWSVAATAERFQVDAKTVRKWRDRFLAEGDAGLWDRSSRPRRSPNRTPEAQRLTETRRRCCDDHLKSQPLWAGLGSVLLGSTGWPGGTDG